MANSFLNPNWYSMEVLRLLINKKQVAEKFNTNWDKEFHQKFAVGESVNVKFPQRFTIRDGMPYTGQGINRISTPVKLDQVFGVDFDFDSYERSVKMERSESEIKEQYLNPIADQLAQELDSRAALFAYQNASCVVGVLGTNATTYAPFLSAEQRLFEKACPENEARYNIVSASQMASLVSSNTLTQFNPSDEVTKQYKKGVIGTAMGATWVRSNSLYRHTAGTWADAVTVNTVPANGATSMVVNCTSGDTFLKGDKFSVANVNSVNPGTRRVAGAGTAQHFTITQDVTASATTATIYFLPAIYGPGQQYQNVNALPAGSAALTLWPGTSTPNGKTGTVGLSITNQAFALVGAEFATTKDAEISTNSKDPQTGLSVAFLRQMEGRSRNFINRFDMCIGFGNLYQDNGVVAIAMG